MGMTTTWRRSYKDGAGAKVRFEAVCRDHLLMAANMDGERFVAFLGHQIWPLVWGREGGANGPPADIHIEGILKRRWQLLGCLCVRQQSCRQWRGCHVEILHKVERRWLWCRQHLLRKADRSTVDQFC